MNDTTKHTPGPWDVGCFVSDDTTCKCRSILVEGYAGSVAQVSLSNGIPLISDGGNDCPPLEEARANGHLIAAAPELLGCQTMGAEINTPDFLDWIASRLVDIYGEDPNVDYVLSLRSRAKAGRSAIAKARGES